MGILLKLVDFILFLYFLLIAIIVPLIDAQTCLPLSYFPDFLVNVKTRYADDYGDHLVADRPHFFVGLIWLELLFQWPLALLNLYALLGSKNWFNTTCLIYGVSFSTFMVAVLSDMMGSKKASFRLLALYFRFMCFGVLATLRGLVPNSSKSSSAFGKRLEMAMKNRVSNSC